MQATKRPWKLYKCGTGPNKNTTFDYIEVAPKRWVYVEGTSDVEANANAAMIVRAVNTFDQARALLKRAFHRIDDSCTVDMRLKEDISNCLAAMEDKP